MVEKANLEFRLRKIDERKKYLLDEIKHNNLLIEKHKRTCNYLNYVEHLLIPTSKITGFVTISAFASSFAIPVGITSSAVGIQICAIILVIKNYKSVIKKKNKKHDKLELLGKAKLNNIEVLISKALIDSYISHGEFVSINSVLREHYALKEEIKNPETSMEYII